MELILENSSDSGGVRFAQASLSEANDLVISGQDLGSGVSDFWGEGLTEYEWSWTLKAVDVEKLVIVLREIEGSDSGAILQLLEATWGDVVFSKAFFETHGIAATFWSRLGD